MQRRAFLAGVSATVVGGVAGCLGSGPADAATTSVAVSVQKRAEGPLTADVGLLEPGEAFEDGIAWRVTFGEQEDSIEVVEDDLGADRYRIVVRAAGYDDYEYDWRPAECVELAISVEVTADQIRETGRACRRP